MTRPQTEAEYLARLIPSSVAGTTVGRRTVLQGAIAAGAALGLPGLLAACSSNSSTSGSTSGGAPTGTLSVGSNYSDAIPKAAFQAVADAYHTKTPGVTVKINTVDHNTFQENINNYLQGKPDDVFTWFAGYRMRFFASQGLAGDISDVWSKLSGFSDAFKTASTGDDGKQYFVPLYNYPWAVFYRPSVFSKYGYTPPKTLDEMKTLSAKMQKDGLIPIAFADKDGWPAMGTFDILNMRINGFQFHIDLMAHKESWSDPKVKTVFKTWAELLPLHQTASLGRTWQEAAQTLQQKKAGMYLLGSFVSQQVDQGKDLDFFTFPEVDSNVGSDALDAPIDGFMMAKKPKNETAARDFLAYLGTPEAAVTYGKTDSSDVLANSKADTSFYNDVQKKSAALIGSAKNIAQFLDRDTRPDFASTVMIPALQSFIKNPSDIDGLTSNIEAQAKSIFT
jgi:multiple sugar transport system substrate-binding protein